MSRRTLIISCLTVSLLLPLTGLTQTASDRAGDIKLWRQQCNDRDPDLRTAYVEEAIETKGVSIQRICIRLALESSDDDVRNLGLRAAITMIQELTFKVEMPEELQQASKDAEDDDEKTAALNSSYHMRIHSSLKNGLTFKIDNASISNARSEWLPYGDSATPNASYTGIATVIGDELAWVGNALLASSNFKCQLATRLGSVPQLEGTLQCGDWVYPVTAKLL